MLFNTPITPEEKAELQEKAALVAGMKEEKRNLRPLALGILCKHARQRNKRGFKSCGLRLGT